MAKDTRRRIAFAATVLVLGSLAFSCARFMGDGATSEEEDRPPIIVRGGGSLIFESGDSTKGNKGKPWKREKGKNEKKENEEQWKPDHSQGIPANFLKVTFENGSGDCVIAYLPGFKVIYKGDDGPKNFLVTRRPRDKEVGTLAPTIAEVETALESVKDPNYPRLEAAGASKEFTIEFVKADGTAGRCVNPTRVVVDSVR